MADGCSGGSAATTRVPFFPSIADHAKLLELHGDPGFTLPSGPSNGETPRPCFDDCRLALNAVRVDVTGSRKCNSLVSSVDTIIVASVVPMYMS